MGGVALEWSGEGDGDQCALALGEAGGGDAEVVLGGGLGAIDAGSHLDGVEVDFKDALFGPHQFDQHGEIGFEAFAYPAVSGPEEDIFYGLLADGAGAAVATSRAALLDGFPYLYGIKPVVVVKAGILRGYHCARHPSAHI